MVISMKSLTQSAKKNLVILIMLTMFGVLMYVSQVVMASLPNIEIVSLLIILVTRKFGVKAFWSVYIFVGLEILTYGISIWVVNYLYVWAILVLLVLCFRKIDNAYFYAIISSVYGLFFGTFCSVPYFITGGIPMGISYIIGGIGYDLAHCIGNFALLIILYKPLKKVMDKI